MRVFLIPGLGEEQWIFDNIKQGIEAEKVFIDNWELLYNMPEKDLSVIVYGQYLINKFDINQHDLVVGHSMGGWIALQIKQVVGCRAVQISSWTSGAKVVRVPLNRQVMYALAKQGWVFNDAVLQVLMTLYYQQKSSGDVFRSIFKRIQYGDKHIVAKQLMLVYNHPAPPIQVFPDLRIHAIDDHIISPPDEPFIEVPGDHFSLYTYPREVLAALAAIL